LRTEMVAHDGARFRCGDGVSRSAMAAVTGASSSSWLPAMVGHGGSYGLRKIRVYVLEMKTMTWQPSIGQLVSARIVAPWLVLVGQF